MANSNCDLILVSNSGFRPWLSDSVIALAMKAVGLRLDCRVERLESFDSSFESGRGDAEDWLNDALDSNAECHRIVLLPLGSSPLEPWAIRSAAWFSKLDSDSLLFVAHPPTPREYGEWIGSASMAARDSMDRIELIPPKDAEDAIVERIVSAAYWAQSKSWAQCTPTVNVACRGHEAAPMAPGRSVGYLPWSDGSYSIDGDSTMIGAAYRSDNGVGVWDWMPSNVLAGWMVQRYLEGVRGRPFPTGNHDPEALDAVWPILSRIAARSEVLLPAEYSGRLDQVTPTSMGSAGLRYDAQGRVPWDLIWTTFCDLAMAGGPPHRGRLLEAVTAEQVAADPDRYAMVVQEIRRGIELASGLPTLESSAMGWVGVRCTDEPMAAWMLRAIVIENVMVRREGNVLFLPAGPRFRIEKEIKNVITTVAKTAHYWQAHLRTRQPPKPL